MSNANGQSIVILGATSSVARALAHEFARRGSPLIFAARDTDDAAVIAVDTEVRFGVPTQVVRFDADRMENLPRTLERCLEVADGDIGGVVLCYGYMDEQKKAQADPDIAERTMNINLTSAVIVLEQFAAYFADRKAGFIAALSSVAGDRGRQSNYLYGASKAGLTAYLQGLRNRMAPCGVPVTTIKPGFMDTKMTFGLPGLFLVASPEQAGQAIHYAIVRKKDVVYVPWFWRYIMLIIRHVPEKIFKRMKM
ncbi:MAG: SDR family oxidoreductase [Candidatus Hydrogenedentales bacterium]|jgi:short-subunit dehydrogenase